MSKDRAPYFKFYIDDFLSSDDVRAMSVAEIGAYVLLLCTAWGQEPPATLPDDDTRLARWAQMTPEEWAKSRPAVLAPWRPAGNGRLVSPRLKREHEDMQRSSRAKQEAGRTGAAVRWQSHGRAIADPWQNDASPESRVQSPDPKPKAKDTPPPPKGGRPHAEGVSRIYELYPRQVGREAALKAISKAINRIAAAHHTTPADAESWLLDRVRAYAESPHVRTTEPDFLPHPSTWFNGGRYDDHPDEWKRVRTEPRSSPQPNGQAHGAKFGARPDPSQRRAARARRDFAEPDLQLPILNAKAGPQPGAEAAGALEAGEHAPAP